MITTPDPELKTSLSQSTAMGLTPWLHRLRSSPDSILLLLAVLIGSGTGLGVVLFRSLIQGTYYLMFSPVLGQLSAWGHWTLGLIPLAGGLVVGLMRWQLKDFGPGLAALLSTLRDGRPVSLVKSLSKMVAAAVSLGSGASLGPEGPSVEIGANVSIGLGQALKVSQERQHLLLAAGAAAGLAAGFNAPIAGVFFALEVVLGVTSVASNASVILLGAVVAAWITQISLGAKPAFALPAYETRSLLELPLYLGLGVLASLVSLFFGRAIRIAQRSFQGKVRGLTWLAKIPQALHPLLGGLAIGAIALKYPQILGVGYETVESILQDVQLPLQFVATLLILKLIMTAISCGSGFVGGVFAPALFLGASLGSAYGKLLAIALPQLESYIASPPAYAMVGMATVLAGTVRAPLTAILLLFELTRDYRIVLPLMAAVSLSTWLMERLQGPPLMPMENQDNGME
ncbi:MAG: chloride channel protein [Nodosilinea sp. LVE1205-7]|jgi:H+/Cl- antiporter ClcA